MKQLTLAAAADTLICTDDDGNLHSYDDKPACRHGDGSEHWYKHGKLHRDNGPAIINPRRGEIWYQNGEMHRDDGPAIDYSQRGVRMWYHHGKLHRLDGPAVINENKNLKEYWIYGVQYRKNEFTFWATILQNNVEKSIDK